MGTFLKPEGIMNLAGSIGSGEKSFYDLEDYPPGDDR